MFVPIRYVFSVFLALAATAPTAQAAPVATTNSAIVAVVNDEAITSYDLNARIQFVLATTKISSSPESIARLKPQILRALVDERLQLQEARKNDIELTDKEVEQAIVAIESQRSMEPGEIGRILATNRIPEETLMVQIRAQIVWGKLVQRKLRSRIKITDEEVTQMARKLAAPVIRQELKIALLQLPVDKPSRDKEVRQAAEKIVLESRGGADFEELARQFAGGAVRDGGNLTAFWVRPDDLDPSIAKALTGAKPGSISDPLRNSIGYTLIKVYDARDLPGQTPTGTEITMREISLKLRSSADSKEMEALKTIAEEIEKTPGSCDDKDIGEVSGGSVASIAVEKTTAMLADLPAALRVIADGMKVGDISSPLLNDDGVKLYMLCGKREGVNAPVDNERARAVVYQQRIELEAQKYMRNLRRDAFIEIRG
ncbi:MAG: peptidylprolyl isomerase [Alphaproteobacteria bacterium]|nr:peptidylprolyl isomerase [Alphaproteobacteria bacterium]